MKTRNKLHIVTSILLSLAAVSAHAVDPTSTVDIGMPKAIDFGGTTKTDGWYNLSSAPKNRIVQYQEISLPGNSGYPSFFQSSNPWPSPIDSQVYTSGSSTASLSKSSNGVAGGPIPSGDSIYFGSFGTEINTFGGALTVTESDPIANLATVMLQVEIGEAYTYDFYDGIDYASLPVLTLNYGDSQTITMAATFTEKVMALYNGTVEMPTGPGGSMQDEDIFVNLWGFQYDVSGYDDITSYSLEFGAVEHAQLYALQLDQSDISYGSSMIPVPEPSTWAFGLGIATLLFASLRRRRAASA